LITIAQYLVDALVVIDVSQPEDRLVRDLPCLHPRGVGISTIKKLAMLLRLGAGYGVASDADHLRVLQAAFLATPRS